MHALGIRTTRALTLVTSDTPVQRETLEQGAILTRLARSHLRIGHFEHFYHQNSHQSLREFTERLMRILMIEVLEMTNP